MREQSLFPVAAATLTAFTLAAAVLMMPDPLRADEPGQIRGEKLNPQTRSGGQLQAQAPAQAPTLPPGLPAIADRQPAIRKIVLDETDQFAALESIQFALTEVGDGASYIWHRNNGRLSGMVQPTGSFKASSGEVCRHVLVMLTSGTRSKKTEGVACRLPSGQWRLEG